MLTKPRETFRKNRPTRPKPISDSTVQDVNQTNRKLERRLSPSSPGSIAQAARHAEPADAPNNMGGPPATALKATRTSSRVGARITSPSSSPDSRTPEI